MLEDEEEAACARCRRPTRVEAMALWTTRERVRSLARTTVPAGPIPRRDKVLQGAGHDVADTGTRPPAFRYAAVTRADAVCAACHARLVKGASLDGPERWRTWLTFAAFLVIAAALVWGVPAILPNLVAAFWRNGAGGR